MVSIKGLENEINKIKARNERVETEKSWETSWFRRFLILIITYIVIVLVFIFAELPDPYINSIVPTVAFFLSTLSLPFFKRLWVKINKK